MKFQRLAAGQQFASAVANLDLSPQRQNQSPRQEAGRLPAAVALVNSAPLKSAVACQLNQHLLNLRQIQRQQQRQRQKQRQEQQQVSSDEEDELDEFADEQPQVYGNPAAGHFYESLQALNQRQQQQQQNLAAAQSRQGSPATTNAGDTQQQQQHSSAFLMDKNKKLFPQKLWELIHNPNIQHCLRWSQDGQRVYLNRNEFEQYYLKTPNNQFHTQKAISFVRQMNMYGFRKVDDCYYENDNFRRDRKQLLKNMIRRHPNKGLFVGLVDHHQLAAAAAAQQALQVNQQLQQLENQHKQRAEQALRLNNYLNQQHHQQQHPAFHQNFALAQAAAQLNQTQGHPTHNQMKPQQQQPPPPPPQQQHAHSSPFEQMSAGRLVAAQVAASHYSIGHLAHQQQQQQQPVGENLTISSKNKNQTSTTGASISPPAAGPQDNPNQAKTSQHQPKKSRLLSDFYASQQQQQQLLETSQTNGGSQSPPSVILGEAKFGGFQAVSSAVGQSQVSAAAAANQARQAALHETLVRSLLQLKQSNHMGPHHHQDLVVALAHQKQQQQQQQQRTLLESLASLSSAGTGSIVDPASNSPTERTATPPSSLHSPHHYQERGHREHNSSSPCDIGMALDLATTTAKGRSERRHHDGGGENEQEGEISSQEDEEEEDDEFAIDVGDEHEQNRGRTSEVDNEMAASPLDGTKKVRRFLEDQMARVVSDELASDQMQEQEEDETAAGSNLCRAIKRELADDEELGRRESRDRLATAKRAKLEKRHDRDSDQHKHQDPISISRRLVREICSRRGDQLNEFALDEAAKYAQCFLHILIDDASLIASHADGDAAGPTAPPSDCTEDKKTGDEQDGKQAPSSSSSSAFSSSCSTSSSYCATSSTQRPIDVPSLSRALQLIPAKLIPAIQRQGIGGAGGQGQALDDVSRTKRQSGSGVPIESSQAGSPTSRPARECLERQTTTVADDC